MNPHDDQPRDEQPRETDPAEGIDHYGARSRRLDDGADNSVAADDDERAGTPPDPVPGPDDDREWYPL